jgi:lipid-binding SYLF domain-containing protein
MQTLSVRLISVLIAAVFVSFLAPAGPAFADSAEEINAKANAALDDLYSTAPAAKELSAKAAGILIFPSVVKAGIGIGGEYGEGALRVGGATVEYYSTASGSIGFQLGVQKKSIVIMFMNDAELKKFRNSSGWEVGVDGSVALIEIGAGGAIDTTTGQKPIIGFVFGQKGLMYNLTLEGSKMTKIVR